MDNHLYTTHVQSKLAGTRRAMTESALDHLVLYSGATEFPFRDDLPYPFRANSHFLEWVPLPEPECFLHIDHSADRPQLYLPVIDDFWHSAADPAPVEVEACFDIHYYRDEARLRAELLKKPNCALVGLIGEGVAADIPTLEANPARLIDALERNRTQKTDWELHCIRAANALAVSGHAEAARLFKEGRSELEIHLGYLAAIGFTEEELPYGNIVGLNANAAVLHHWRLGKSRPEKPLSLLIDAGASHKGYAADITRTHTTQSGLFADLLVEMDALQQSIAARVAPGVSFAEVHAEAFDEIGALLQTTDIITAVPEHPALHDLIHAFFPHGLGHFLGIQVHDTGGYSAEQPASGTHPHLRLTQTLEPNNVVTIEPGLYFIPSLLADLHASPAKSLVNWELIEELKPYGGIRIEDNLIVTDAGAENATRDAFAKVD